MCINGGNAIYHCRSLLDLFELLAVLLAGLHFIWAQMLFVSLEERSYSIQYIAMRTKLQTYNYLVKKIYDFSSFTL